MSFFAKKSYGDLKDNNFGALPEGFYELVVESAKIETTKAGVPMTNVMLSVRKDANEKYGNRKLFKNFVHSDNETSEDFVLRFMLALGTPEEHLALIDSQEAFVNYIIAKPVRAKVKQKPHYSKPGEMDNEIHWFEKSQVPFIKPEASAEDHPVYEGQLINILPDGDLPF